MFFNKKKKANNKHLTLSKADYGKAVLSYIVMRKGSNFESLLKELGKEWDSGDYLWYLQYIVYISEKILETRFSSADASQIAVSSFDGIVEYLDMVDDDAKNILAESMKEQYLSCMQNLKFNIYTEAGLHSLVNSFLEDINVGKCFTCHFAFFTDFSSFIIHHTSSIFNDNITIV